LAAALTGEILDGRVDGVIPIPEDMLPKRSSEMPRHLAFACLAACFLAGCGGGWISAGVAGDWLLPDGRGLTRGSPIVSLEKIVVLGGGAVPVAFGVTGLEDDAGDGVIVAQASLPGCADPSVITVQAGGWHQPDEGKTGFWSALKIGIALGRMRESGQQWYLELVWARLHDFDGDEDRRLNALVLSCMW